MILRRVGCFGLWLFGMALIIGSGSSSDSSSDGAPTWSKSFGGELNDSVASAIPTADGGYLFVGNRDAVRLSIDDVVAADVGRLWVTKLDALGDIEWESRLSDAGLSAESGLGRDFDEVVAAADGGAWLIGTEFGSTHGLVVARLGSGGEILWTRTYDSDSALPYSHFYPDGTTTETQSRAAVETPEGTLWIAVRAEAFVRDASDVDGGRDRGVRVASLYMLKLAADGAVLVSRHTNINGLDSGVIPQAVHVLADGGVAVLDSVAGFVLLTDAGGALRSKTAIEHPIGAVDPSIVDVVPMRRAADPGVAGDDDGYVVVGQQSGHVEDSFVARYFAVARDPDDPTEGEDGGEVSPRENAWRLEVPEIAPIWVAAANCGPAPSVGHRCGVIVAGKGRDAAGTMALARIDADGNVGAVLRFLPDIALACAIHPEPALTAAGRLAFRLLVLRPDGRSGTLVIDDGLNLIEVFREDSGRACSEFADRSASFAPDGEWVGLTDTDNTLVVSRMTSGGAERWRQSFATASRSGQFAFVALQTDDDGDGALDDGYLVAGEREIGFETQPFVIKLGPQGAISWQRALPGLHFPKGAGTRFAAVQSGGYGLVVLRDSNAATYALKMDPTGAINWQQPLWNDRLAASIAPLRDGGWLVGAGHLANANGVLIRLASSGAAQWTRTLSELEVVDSIYEAASGELVVGGRRQADPAVAKFDASGLPIWSRRVLIAVDIEAPDTGAVHVAPAPDDGVFIATTVVRAIPDATPPSSDPAMPKLKVFDRDVLLHQFDADGTPRAGKERRYGGLYDDVLTSLRATSDGGAILAARSNSLGERNDRTEGWLLRVGPDGGVALGCAAELAGNQFPAILVLAGAETSAVADPLVDAVDGAPFPVPTDFSLFNLPSTAPTTVARQCSGSVGPAPGTPQAPVARLGVIQGGAITGVVSSVPGGILCGTGGGGTCEANFDQGLMVTLNVDPGSRSTFESWSGCDTATGPQCLVLMGTADRTVTATFATEPRSPTVNLILNSITGRGRVTGTGGLNCRSVSSSSDTCVVSVQRGSTAQLTATPDGGRSFLGWGGGCAAFGTTRTISFLLDEGRGCTAQFSGPPLGAPEISVDVRPDFAGNVTSAPAGIDCGASNSLCTEGFASGTDVTLTATAALAGWEFDDFLCLGQVRTPERSITLPGLTSSTPCQANFSNGIERLFVRIVRDASGALANGRVYVEDINGRALDCRQDCDRPFLRDQLLIVRAEPLPQYVLSAWSGCRRVLPDNTNPGADSYCEVLLDQRREVVAFFSALGPGPNPLRSLVVNFANGSAPGLVTSNPGAIDCTPTDGICVATFAVGTTVTLTAAPAAGGSVASNVGCDTFTPASGAAPALCGVTLGADRVVTFGFARANSAPIAAYTFEPANPTAGQTITFNAASSTDDNGIASYAWSFRNNGAVNATSSVATHTYLSADTYTARLTVTDADGLSDDELRTIVVAAAPQPLVLLNVNASGGGRVVSTPPGIDCSSQQSQPCSASFTRDQIVTLAVTPNVGQGFDSWAGDPGCADNVAPNGTATVNLALALGTATNLSCRANFYTPLNSWVRDGLSLNITPPTLPASVGAPAIELGANGLAIAAFAENGAVVVRRWDGGGAWQTMGTALGNGTAETVSLAVDSTGAPVVAWDEPDTTVTNGTRNVSVARWSGTAWVTLGGAFVDIDLTADAFSPSIRARSADVALAWAERSFQTGESRIVVRTWNGTAWVNPGSAAALTSTAPAIAAPQLAVGPADELAVLWLDDLIDVRIAELQSGTWVPTATPPFPSGVSSADIAYTAAEGLIVAAQPATGVIVRRWRGGAWSDLGTLRGDDGGLRAIISHAFSHNRTGAMPLLAYSRVNQIGGSAPEFIVERFSGTDWARVGGAVPAIDRHGGGATPRGVGVVDAWLPSVVTTVSDNLPGTAQSDDSIVVYRFR